MLHIYPDDQFEFIHTSITLHTHLPYTWESLKKHILSHVANYSKPIRTHQRNRIIDDILIDNEKTNYLLGAVWSVQFRIKYWALKKESQYFSHSFVIPYSFWLVQELHGDDQKILVCNINEPQTTYIKIDNHWISSLSKINYWVDQILRALDESGITNIQGAWCNQIWEKIIDTIIEWFVDIFSKRLWNTWTYKIILTWSLLHYPLLSERFISKLSKKNENFVWFYIWNAIDVGYRNRSTDELYVKHHIYRFSKKQKRLTSFWAPTM